MTVSEFINFWDSVNITTIPISYVYKDKAISKFKLYNITEDLTTLKLKYSFEDLKEEHIGMYHNKIPYELFNYDQINFYNDIRLEIPENIKMYTLHLYIN